MKQRIWGLLLALALFLPGGTAMAADMPYRITVNLTKNIVTVYGRDQAGGYTVPKKAFVCSGGQATPTGVFRTTDKYVWRPLIGNVYGQYATRITGSILFHSVPYFRQDKSTLEYLEYNKLGSTASAGCIRLTVADAKWIYDHCPAGTTVQMYRDNRTEPLQPQSPVRIDPDDARRGWDPTDPDSENPWAEDEAPEWLTAPQAKAEEWGAGAAAQQEESRMDSLYVQGGGQGAVWTAEGSCTGMDCRLSAQDAKRVFGLLGVSLVLPQQEGSGRVDVRYQRLLYPVSVLGNAGKAYYSLTELAKITGTEASRTETGGFCLFRNGEEIRIERL